MQTKFAPPNRLPGEEVKALSEALRHEVLLPWLDAVPMGMLVLNQHRQIIYCNEAFSKLAHKPLLADVLGQRPGEALDCIHSHLEPGGCGCSDFCRLCGAAQAILKSLRGEQDCQECRLMRLLEGVEIPTDLQVFTRPIPFRGAMFSLVTALDISHEKRLRYLERTFYHDLVNMAGGMASLANMLELDTGGEETSSLFAQCSQRLLREILYHRDVTAAENGRLHVNPETIPMADFLVRVSKTCCEDAKTRCVPVRLDIASEDIFTDRRILGHVLRNMLLNAQEACSSNTDEIFLSCYNSDGGECIRVENPGEIPADIQKQLFKRYVSSKGDDRGLGTYVMRLLAERYLGGKVKAESGGGRTIFILELQSQA